LDTEPVESDDSIDFHDFAQEIESRNDILTGSITGKSLHLFSAPPFAFDPKSSILVKKIIKQLGLYDVYTPESEQGNSTRTSKYQIKGKVAQNEVYHGTSSEYILQIMKLGLRPGVSKTNYEAIVHKDAVFFTSRVEEALHHAIHTASKVGGSPVILEMKIPDMSLLIPDYDIDVGSENSNFDYISALRSDNQKMKGKSFSLSREFGIYGYKGRIPPNHIVGLAVVHGEGDDYPEIDDFKELDLDEIKTYIYTLENLGYYDPDYDPDESEEDESEEDESEEESF
jgi:hypothetical protein